MWTDEQTDRQTDRQADRQTDGQTDRKKEGGTDRLKFATTVPKNVSQCHPFLHKSDMEWYGIESEPPRRESGD
jgi:hypothetical protein